MVGFFKGSTLLAYIACLLFSVLLAAWSSPASAAVNFGGLGTGAGQLKGPSGVAVGPSGEVYVGELSNNRVSEFNGTNQFQLAWGAGVIDGTLGALQTCTVATGCKAGNGVGVGFAFSAGVAVDGSGNIYIVDKTHHRVEKFKLKGGVAEFVLMFGGHVNEESSPVNPNLCVAGEKCKEGVIGTNPGEFSNWSAFSSYIAVGPGGDIYVGDTGRVQVFEPSGVLKEDISLAALSATAQPSALAVDSAGDIFVKDAGVGGAHELEPNGTLRAVAFDGVSTTVTSLAVDNKGHLFAGDSSGGFHVLEFAVATGEELEFFGSHTVAAGANTNLGLAYTSANGGSLYATENVNNSKCSVWELPLPAAGPLVGAQSVTAEAHDAATFEATIDPEGSSTKYHFEYVTQTQFGGKGFTGATSTPEETLPASFGDQQVSVKVTGLTAGETYRWRLVAANQNGTTTSEGEAFTEIAAATIEGPWAVDVVGEAATLSANLVNVQSLKTEYTLEYGTTLAYGRVAGAGSLEGASLVIGGRIQGLEPATIYHYRVVAANSAGTAQSADHTFTTQLAGGSMLPDDREWELVSPSDKHGALIENNEAAYNIQAAANGSGIAYVASEPMPEKPTTESPVGRPWSFEQMLSQRVAGVWSTKELSVPESLLAGVEASLLGKKATLPPALFSSDLGKALVSPGALTPLLSKEATEPTIYIRNNEICSTPELCYRPIVYPGDALANIKFGTTEEPMEFLGASHDFSHIVFQFPLRLTPEAYEHPLCLAICKSLYNLYEWVEGKLLLINILPGPGKKVTPEPDQVYVGRKSKTLAHAVSADGRRIVWSYEPNNNEVIYEVRDTAEEKTEQLGGASALFQTMNEDGSRIFYLESEDLHVLDFASEKQVDITASHPGENNAGVQDEVLGTSSDGSAVYFVATGVLASGAVAGGDNLYVAQEKAGEWKISLIATLSGEDEKSWAAIDQLAHFQVLSKVTSRVSPNGRYVAFMSARSLTGYDNIDASSSVGNPRRDEEVYVYDADTHRLTCASCDPTGARPVGVAEEGGVFPLVDRKDVWKGHSLAGSVPSWNDASGGLELYQPRFLGNEGRLFFDSPDGLVPQDTNGLEDVYVYEPQGTGPKGAQCGPSAASGSEVFKGARSFMSAGGENEEAAGCVALISSGTSSAESVFYDASESGDDVFFATTSQLSKSDIDGSYDVYDAHVCPAGGLCASPPPQSPPVCATTDACRAAPAAQPEIFGPTASATFSGSGNVPPPAAGVRGKALTEAQKLARALSACRREKGARRRHACERKAHKRYGAKQSRVARTESGGGK